MKKLAAAKLRALLNHEGLVAADLAAVLDVQRSTVSRWLAGTSQPDGDNLGLLAKVFAVTADDLLTPTKAELEVVRLRAKLAELSPEQPGDDF